MLSKRIITGLILIGIFLVVIVLDEWLAPWFPFWFVLVALAMGRASVEIARLLARTSARPSVNTVFGGVQAIVVANWVPHVLSAVAPAHLSDGLATASPVNVMAWPCWAFIGVVMCTFIAQSVQFDEPGRTMATIAGTLLAIAYIGLLGSCVIQMRWFEGPREGLLALAALLATAKGADTGAYAMGRLAGRRPLWPRLSPNKTVEGAVGGLVFATVGALAVNAVAHLLLDRPLLEWLPALGFGLVVGAAAQLGDLMESMIKRDCSQKDASNALPGFGGVLDVLDSLLFAGPVAYAYWLVCGA